MKNKELAELLLALHQMLEEQYDSFGNGLDWHTLCLKNENLGKREALAAIGLLLQGKDLDEVKRELLS